MKKAYVKPVFLAEEFVATLDHVASCPTNTWAPQQLQFPTKQNGKGGTHLCSDSQCAHSVGQNPNAGILDDYETGVTYQEYAAWDVKDRANAGEDGYEAKNAYLFNSGHGACDFVWDNTNQNVGVWVWETKNEKWGVKLIETLGDFGNFFYGAKANNDGHKPAINGTVIPS